MAPEGVPASRLRRLWTGLEESAHQPERDADAEELLETEILEEEPLAWETQVAEEMEWRQQVLGRLYPFRLETRLTNWKLTRAPDDSDDTVCVGRSFYLFCLLISALRDSRIEDHPDRGLIKQAERDFEQVATTAGAGTLGGDAIAFGWPRGSRTSFRAALDEVESKLGWTPLHENPLWSTGQEKDAGIDVIAWRDFLDRRPGRVLLLGQAASGRGWEQKGAEPSVFLNWFTQFRPKNYVPALFTPFPQHHDCGGRTDHNFEDVARAEAWKREQSLGLVVDRLRLVEMAAAHLARSQSEDTPPTVQRLDDWVRRACEAAGGTA
ncbi:MAG: hypothetical protein F4228_01005 [Acidobacteria bacterium]|nr:hypothetical protein [Acidobacteriota bacterium]MYI95902.1 hypothetical protein [Acidobacteriota bacterium]